MLRVLFTYRIGRVMEIEKMKKYLSKLKKYKLATLQVVFAYIFALAAVLTVDERYAIFAVALSLLSSINVQDARIKALEDKIK